MANSKNGGLYAPFEIDFNLIANDQVTSVVRKIARELESLDDSLKGKGTAIHNLLLKATDQLADFSDNLKASRALVKDFFAAPDASKFEAATRQIQATSKAYDESIALFVQLKKVIEENGGETEEISETIRSLNADLSALGETLQGVVNRRLGQLAEKFLATADEGKRLKIEERAVEDATNALGLSADQARKLFENFVEAVRDAGGSFDELHKKQEESEGGFKGFVKSLGSALTGKGGFSNVMKIATGAISSFIGNVGAIAVKVAFQALTNFIRKQIQNLAEWVKSWGEVRRAIREGMGAAGANSLSEIRRLDELKEKLESAEKGTARYAEARKEILSQYGQYNRYLETEIDRVGDLSTTYDQLRASIIQANIAKQQQKALDALYEKQGEKMSKQLAGMYSDAVRWFGKDKASEIYNEAVNSVYGGVMPESAEARELLYGSRSIHGANFRATYARTQKKAGKIDVGMKNNAGAIGTDYTLIQQELAQTEKHNEILRRQKQERIDLEQDFNQRIVNTMRDGASKQIAQAKLSFDQQIAQFKMQKEQMLKQREAERKQMFEDVHGAGSYNYLAVDNIMARSNDNLELSKYFDQLEEAAQRERDAQIREATYNQRQALAASYGTLAQRKSAAEARWGREREGATRTGYAEFEGRANAFHDYELAQMEYEAIQKYGTQDQVRAALEAMLDAEIKTLEDAEKPAAEARKKVTLAEFDAKLAEQYGGREEGRKALEATLNAELETIDEKYKEIKEAMNKVRLAEYDEETANLYGTRGERRAALEARLQAEKEAYLKKNPGADAGRIDRKNAITLAEFDWEQVANYGSYEQMLEKLRAKWQAVIAELPDDLKEGATKKMNKEILDLEMANSEEFKRIFADADSMTKQTLADTIAYADALLQAKINAGANVEEIKALRDQIDKLQAAKDEIDFSGWGGTFQGLMQARNRRNIARDKVSDLMLAQRQMVSNRARGTSVEEVKNSEAYKNLQKEIDKATESQKKWNAEIAKQAAILAASNLGGLLSQVAQGLSEIASISGDDALAGVAEGLSEIGGTISGIAQGFASGGLWGGIATAVTTVASKIADAFISIAKAEAKYNKFLKDFENNLERLKLQVKDADFENAFGVNDYQKFVTAYDKMGLALKKFGYASADLTRMDIKTKDYSWWTNLWGKGDEYEGFKKFDVWGKDGLLDVDKARAFLDASTQLTDSQREQIENAIELKEIYDDLHDKAMGFVSSLTGSVVDSLADEMVQNFIDTGSAIVDADKYLQDFNKNLATSIVKSMLMKQIFTEEAQNDIADLIARGDNRGAIDAYNELLQEANELAPHIEEFLRGAGVTGEAFKQTATTGGFQTMSQDTGTELNGRFAALQIAGENILLESRGIHADTTSMATSASEIQNLVLISMGHLEDIAKYTSVLPDMSERVINIEKYSKQMVS